MVQRILLGLWTIDSYFLSAQQQQKAAKVSAFRLRVTFIGIIKTKIVSPMCGRYNIIDDPYAQALMDTLGIDPSDHALETRYNIAPTEAVPVVLQEDGRNTMRDMRWWLIPHWAPAPSAKYTMFNAKAETIEQSRAYKGPFRYRRCIIPASGYYEWTQQQGKKVATHIKPEKGIFAFAGIWDCWEKADAVIESCSIITIAAHPNLAHIHPRMPLALKANQFEPWLNPNTDIKKLHAFLVSKLPSKIITVPLSNYVNNARHKDEKCLEAAGEAKVIASR